MSAWLPFRRRDDAGEARIHFSRASAKTSSVKSATLAFNSATSPRNDLFAFMQLRRVSSWALWVSTIVLLVVIRSVAVT